MTTTSCVGTRYRDAFSRYGYSVKVYREDEVVLSDNNQLHLLCFASLFDSASVFRVCCSNDFLHAHDARERPLYYTTTAPKMRMSCACPLLFLSLRLKFTFPTRRVGRILPTMVVVQVVAAVVVDTSSWKCASARRMTVGRRWVVFS